MATKTKKIETEETTAKTVKKQLEEVFALWKRTSEKGKEYFTGKGMDYPNIVAFYNKDKQNPKEPDLRVYNVDQDGKIAKKPFVSLWVNVSKNKKKYLSGKLNDRKVIGFIRDKAEEKRPYVNVYYSDLNDTSEELPF